MSAYSRLTYVSRSIIPRDLRSAVLKEILHISHTNNAKVKITGALIHVGNYFGQVIEGSPQQVTDALNRIKRDTRHRDVTVIHAEVADERWFSDWSMAFPNQTENVITDVLPLLERAIHRDFSTGKEVHDLIHQWHMQRAVTLDKRNNWTDYRMPVAQP